MVLPAFFPARANQVGQLNQIKSIENAVAPSLIIVYFHVALPKTPSNQSLAEIFPWKLEIH